MTSAIPVQRSKLREPTQPKLLYIDMELPSDPEVIYKSIVSRSVSEFETRNCKRSTAGHGSQITQWLSVGNLLKI